MRVLIRTDDRLGKSMAGSALRAWEMGRVLEAAGWETRIEAAADSSAPKVGPPIVDWGSSGWGDVLITPPWSLQPCDFMRRQQLLVLDGVTPLPAELAAMPQSEEIIRRRKRAIARLPLALARADALLVAGKAQKRWWQAQLGKRRPDLPVLDLPFGIPEEEPGDEVGELPGLPPDHAVILWWGGVWPWLDLETLLAARARLGRRKLSLVVPVGARPGSFGTSFGPSELKAAMQRHHLKIPEVIGLESWFPYPRRAALLNRASILAVLHHPGEEAELSFRTRAMDGLWAGVPLLLSEGGEVADLARAGGWGAVVRTGDVASTAAAMDLLLTQRYQQRCRQALEESRVHWRWNRLMETLLQTLPKLPAARRDSRVPAGLRSLMILMGWSGIGVPRS